MHWAIFVVSMVASFHCYAQGLSPSAKEREINERMKENAERIANGNDEGRWSQPVYSESDTRSDLEREVIRAAGLWMRLAPKTGHLTFAGPAFSHTFKISTPAGTANSTCPRYNLTIIDASEEHILLKLNCPKHVFSDGSIFMSSEFLLHDVKTSSMRRIWMAFSNEKGQKFPTAVPTPAVRRSADGYRFDWAGVRPHSIDNVPDKIRNQYTWYREKTTGKLELRCTDLDAPKDEAVENSVCGLGYIPLVSKLKK